MFDFDNISERAEKLLENKLKIFYDPSFDDPKLESEILADIPDKENFDFETEKIHKLRRNKVSAELRPCYESALLTFEQEQHLFRKMNFLKYKADKLIKNLNPDNATEKIVLKIEGLLLQAIEVRNKIAESNFRLATQLLKGNSNNYYKQNDLVESMLSDAYFDVIKAVDYFNWTLGNKFSTYTTWALRKNLYRDCQQKINESQKVSRMDDTTSESLESNTCEADYDKKYNQNQKMVSKLLDLLANDDKNPHRERQVLVLKHYFGLYGNKSSTLEEISIKIGISKERVRQLKVKGLEWMQEKIKSQQIEVDDFE